MVPAAAERLFTVGHSNRSLHDLAGILRTAGVTQLVDVRSHPGSKRHPHFARLALERDLPSLDVDYRWMPELGGLRPSDPASVHLALSGTGFAGYADYMLTDAFVDAVGRLLAHAERAPTAIMCAEAKPEHCHRRLLCDWLVAHDVAVTHLLAAGESVRHDLDPRVRLDGGRLFFDRGQLSLL